MQSRDWWNGPPARCGGRPAHRSSCAGQAPIGSRDLRAEARRQVAAENGQVGRSTQNQIESFGLSEPRTIE